MQALHILLVEDEPAIADTIRFTFQQEGWQLTHCLLAQEALQACTHTRFDVAVLDIGLPDMNGLDLLRSMSSQTPLPTILLTARANELDRVLGLEMGADDYLTKPFSPRELVARVRALLRRIEKFSPVSHTAHTANASDMTNPAVSPNHTPTRKEPHHKIGPFTWDEAAHCVYYYGQRLLLTPTEYGLLGKLLRHPQRILSRAQLQDHPYSKESDALERTIDAHIKSLRAKLRAIHAAHDPIQTQRGFGYLLHIPPDTPPRT